MNCEASLRSHFVHVKVKHRQQSFPQLGAPEHLKKPVAEMQRVFCYWCRILVSRSDKAETSAQSEESDLHNTHPILAQHQLNCFISPCAKQMYSLCSLSLALHYTCVKRAGSLRLLSLTFYTSLAQKKMYSLRACHKLTAPNFHCAFFR